MALSGGKRLWQFLFLFFLQSAQTTMQTTRQGRIKCSVPKRNHGGHTALHHLLFSARLWQHNWPTESIWETGGNKLHFRNECVVLIVCIHRKAPFPASQIKACICFQYPSTLKIINTLWHWGHRSSLRLWSTSSTDVALKWKEWR